MFEMVKRQKCKAQNTSDLKSVELQVLWVAQLFKAIHRPVLNQALQIHLLIPFLHPLFLP
jgi:hypothetical protein